MEWARICPRGDAAAGGEAAEWSQTPAAKQYQRDRRRNGKAPGRLQLVRRQEGLGQTQPDPESLRHVDRLCAVARM